MTDAPLGLMVQNFYDLISRDEELLQGVALKLQWMKTEFTLMLSHWQSIEATVHPSKNVSDLIVATETVIQRAKDAVVTYATMERKRKMAPTRYRLSHWFQSTGCLTKLELVQNDIVKVRRAWRCVDFADWHQQDSLSEEFVSGAALAKLDGAVHRRGGWAVIGRQLMASVEWVGEELAPLHVFLLQPLEPGHELGERLKLWVQELEGVFWFVNETFTSFQPCDGERGAANKKISQVKFARKISEIQDKILDLYRRYCTYGIGEIGEHNILPRIRMSYPVPRTPQLAKSSPSTSRLTHGEWDMESLRVELALMKALLLDGRSIVSYDERMKVWLQQMEKISADLDALNEHFTDISHRKGKWFASRMKDIGIEIEQISARKLRYGIGSTRRESALLYFIATETSGKISKDTKLDYFHVRPEFSKHNFRKNLHSVEQELQLMQALREDAHQMDRLEGRLKFWLGEMQEIAQEANEIVEHKPTTRHTRRHALRRMYELNNRLCIMSKWKHTYDIRDFKSYQCSVPVDQPEEIRVEHPGTMEKYELLRREIELMEVLGTDVKEMDMLDETAKAWVTEMLSLAGYAKILVSYMASFPGLMAARMFSRTQERITELSDRRVSYSIELRPKLPPNIISEIKEKLLQGDPCIVPILDLGHTEKEALRELVYNDNTIRTHFCCPAWVRIPEDSSATSALGDIALQIMMKHEAECFEEEIITTRNVDEVMQLLPDIMTQKRYIIILDEILTTEVWHMMDQAFGSIQTQSRVILLSSEHTWNHRGSTTDDIPVKLRPGSVEEGTSFQSPLSNLKPFIYHLSLFPTDFHVPFRRLMVLWVSEGLVGVRRNTYRLDEHVAERHLDELIALNWVQVTKRKRNGKVKACRLYPGTREAWLEEARAGNFFKDVTGMISRLVVHESTSTHSTDIHGRSFTPVSIYRNVVSVMSFDTQEGNKPGEDIGNFLRKCISIGCFRGLKTLDLEQVFRPKLPKEVSKLIYLRYLGLRWTYLEKLPGFVNKLLNLEVLDVKHTYISILPKSIWSMQFLRHLYLSEIYRTKFPDRPSGNSLTELQTLWGLFVDENTSVENGLDTLHNISKLGLSCRTISSKRPLMAKQLRAIAKWISDLDFLESLRLKSRDEHGNPSDLDLNPLTNKSFLSTVYLQGKLRPSVVSGFPEGIVDITLSGSNLETDPMPSLENLPELLSLRLLSQSVVRDDMKITSSGFKKLKVLQLWKLENLNTCDAEEGAFPLLEEMEIRACSNLKMLPQALQSVGTLQKLKLAGMPLGFVDEIKVKQAELWEKVDPVHEVDEPVAQA